MRLATLVLGLSLLRVPGLTRALLAPAVRHLRVRAVPERFGGQEQPPPQPLRLGEPSLF